MASRGQVGSECHSHSTRHDFFDSEPANLRQFDPGVLNNVFGADWRPVWRKVGASMPGAVHLKIRSKMRGPRHGCLSRFRPLRGKSVDRVLDEIMRIQRGRETGGIVGRL